jgi:hypothetical protein
MPCAYEDSEKPIFALAEKNNKTKSSCTKTKADVTYLSKAKSQQQPISIPTNNRDRH